MVKLQIRIRSLLLILAMLIMLVLMNFSMVFNQLEFGLIFSRNLMILSLMTLYGYYFFLFHRRIPFNQTIFLILISTSLWTASVFLGETSFLFMPILVVVMLIAINIDQQLAIINHLLGVAIIGIVLDLPLLFYLFYLPG